jgi:sigma-B regulation protein RsbU (phosphoserine phosphatase)
MSSLEESYVRPQLLDRRERLRQEIEEHSAAPELTRLLGEVDAALDRLDHGTYGLCKVCHDHVEPERLLADPLTCVCLDHLDDQQQRDLEQDLETAAALQRRLLPDRNLVAAGWEVVCLWRPAGVVSGDFVDVVVAPDDQSFELVLGDVSGKGVAAGLVTTHLHAAFRTLLAREDPVEKVVARVNRVFRDSALAPHFATLVLLRARRGGRLDVVNAGHWPPLLVTASGIGSIEPSGMPVGAFYSCTYTSRQLSVEEGGVLFAFTDGLIEARNAAGAEYGNERLSALLPSLLNSPAADLVTAVFEDLGRHLGNRPLDDDITLVALRRLA